MFVCRPDLLHSTDRKWLNTTAGSVIPKMQVLMPLIDSDAYELFHACAAGTLASYELKLKESSAVCIVMASNGYPDDYQTGFAIEGLNNNGPGTTVFHAGTKTTNGAIVTSGGRVLGGYSRRRRS